MKSARMTVPPLPPLLPARGMVAAAGMALMALAALNSLLDGRYAWPAAALCFAALLVTMRQQARLRKLPRVPSLHGDDDREIGFSRKEMYSRPLSETVKPYDRHLFFGLGPVEGWPERVEEDAGWGEAVISTVKASGAEGVKTTAIDAPRGELLLFPDCVRYSDVDADKLDLICRQHLLKSMPLPDARPLSGAHAFVCAHIARDARCGACAPVLMPALRRAAAVAGMQLSVAGCSHIGGHKYAGNVLLFGRRRSCGQVTADWYGYVTPEDAPLLLKALAGNAIVKRLWRGAMGAAEESIAELEEKPGINAARRAAIKAAAAAAVEACEDCDCGLSG